jgi:ribosomal protein L39E
MQKSIGSEEISAKILKNSMWMQEKIAAPLTALEKKKFMKTMKDERGDVPGWVLVVLMTTGLVTAIWTIAAPRLSAILKNSLDAMNGIR